MLLHPLDFLGGDEEPDLAFFPGMKHSGSLKRKRLQRYLAEIASAFTVQTQGEAAARLDGREYSRRVPQLESDVIPASTNTSHSINR